MTERTLDERKAQEGQTFACVCGNIHFTQDCYVKTEEVVQINKQTSGEMMIVSLAINDEKEEADIEYDNTFKCPKCQTIYAIGTKDGIDTIYRVGVDEKNE